MRIRTYLLLIILSVAFFSSCVKTTVDPSLISSRQSISTVSTGTSTRGSNNLAALNFELRDQKVSVNLTNKTLSMNYNEDITLLARKDSLAASWSIIFTESFLGTELAKYNYTTTSKTGNVTTNYAEPNLNNVAIRSTKDTVINSITYTKLSFNRNFLFANTYGSSIDAATQFDHLLNTKDVINFSAFITSAAGRSSVANAKAVLLYN